ncbi:MAG: hypothetical protein E7507_04025 [Ruminococcus sp.]|nr:hypothetical protein [Ruminococcus sp.]
MLYTNKCMNFLSYGDGMKMAKKYWAGVEDRDKSNRPRFSFGIVFLIVILSFAICFGIYMYIAGDGVFGQSIETASVTETTPAETTTAETTAATTTAATTTVATEPPAVNPVPENATPKDDSYLENCVFIGDSITLGFSSYGVIPEKNVYASIGMNIDKINTEAIPIMLPDENDESVYAIREMTIIEALEISRPETVYIMLGSNGIAWLSNEHMIASYKTFVDSIRAILPETDIYILSIPPVTAGREVPDNANGQILNENIDSYNSELLKFANENDLYFVDINTALKGNDGKLPTESAGRDGMHFNKDTYFKVKDYILSHTAEDDGE